ncbi:MAG TPA: hypothetical protein VF071_05575 [Candidatus Limnocylindria bacterium]
MSRSESPVALVSISAGRARVLRWRDGEVIQLDLPSDVPGRHKSTSHVRHDPMVRHGGSGPGQDEVDGQRAERITQFLARVTDAVREDERIMVVGSGRLPRELAERLEQQEHGRPRPRLIELEHAGYLTDPQLRARLLAWAGHPPRRRRAAPRRQTGRLRRDIGRAPERERAEELEELEELGVSSS